jgi:CDP-glucose 4,6-dehydratase
VEFWQGSLEKMGRLKMNRDFWKNKKVFITGHTGFKGSWLSILLQHYGAELRGFSLPSNTSNNLFGIANVADGMDSIIGDIRDLDCLKKSIVEFAPDVVIHMAAQPLVRLSYKDPVDTYSTNVMGTVNLLESVRFTSSVKAVVNVTTDKCYENNEWVWGYRENEPMGGYDPYSNSKGCSELVTSAYRRSFFGCDSGVSLASARAGNVIGGGDWSDDRLIPDALKAFEENLPVTIRNPLAIRPWQHVLEPIAGYLTLAENLYTHGDAFAEGWNFGPKDNDVKPVGEIMDYLVQHWRNPATWIVDENEQPHEAQFLKLDISKALSRLTWEPKWNLTEALDNVIQWHEAWLDGSNMQCVTLNQISDYEKA